MPRVNLYREDPIYYEIKCRIKYVAGLKRISDDSLAVTMGRTKRTLQNRYKDMENMTLGELVRLSRRLGGLGIEL